MTQHIRSSSAFHHSIARTSGVKLNPRKIVRVLFDQNFCSFPECFLISPINLCNWLLLRRSHNMLDNLTWIDDKAICIHKFSPKLNSIIRVFIFFKNLTRDKASRTVGDSIHRSKAEFHVFSLKQINTSKSIAKSCQKSSREKKAEV